MPAGSIVIEMGLNTKRMTKSLKGVQKNLQNFKHAVIAVYGGRAIGAVLGYTKRVLEAQDAIGKFSAKVGESTEFLSTMGFVAEKTGVKTAVFNVAVQRANRRLAEFALTGKGEAAAALKILGPEFEKAARKGASFSDILPQLADRFRDLKGDNRALLASFKLFDTEGTTMRNLLSIGSLKIQEEFSKGMRLGATVTDEQSEAAMRAVDALTDLQTAWSNLLRMLVNEMGPGLTSAAQALLDVVLKVTDATKEVDKVSLAGRREGAFQEYLLEHGYLRGTGRHDRVNFDDSTAGRGGFDDPLRGIKAGPGRAAPPPTMEGRVAEFHRFQNQRSLLPVQGPLTAAQHIRNEMNAPGWVDRFIAKFSGTFTDITGLGARPLAEMPLHQYRRGPELGAAPGTSAEDLERAHRRAQGLEDPGQGPIRRLIDAFNTDLSPAINRAAEIGSAFLADISAGFENLRDHPDQLKVSWVDALEGIRDSAALNFNSVRETMAALSLETETFSSDFAAGVASQIQTLGEFAAETTNLVVRSLAATVAHSLVEGKSLVAGLKVAAKLVAQAVIQSLIQIAVQRLILSRVQKAIGAAETAGNVGRHAVETWSGSFAYFAQLNPITAPLLASAVLAEMLGGIGAAFGAGAGAGGSVAGLARGGIVQSPQMGLLGESGSEAIIPIDRLGEFLPGGRSQNISVYLDGEVLAASVAEHLPNLLVVDAVGR